MPAARRASAFGTMVASISLAFAAGPLLSGALVATVGWRVLVVVALPFTLIAVLLALRWVPLDPSRHGDWRALDLVGQHSGR
jgi:DHA2 family lincomycin resistance protein-like MFS transporter